MSWRRSSLNDNRWKCKFGYEFILNWLIANVNPIGIWKQDHIAQKRHIKCEAKRVTFNVASCVSSSSRGRNIFLGSIVTLFPSRSLWSSSLFLEQTVHCVQHRFSLPFKRTSNVEHLQRTLRQISVTATRNCIIARIRLQKLSNKSWVSFKVGHEQVKI